MNINWKKSIIIVCDIAIATYLILAVTAFNKPDAVVSHCTEVKIDVETDAVDGFLTADGIKKILIQAKAYPLSLPMQDINPRLIEETLQKSPFAEKAECYKTQYGQVCIQVKQRVPVIRIMANSGKNYYIDSHGNTMPESRYVIDIMIATGYISPKYAQKYLTKVANFIQSDKFWQNQIEQINVQADGTIEMVPRVGDHIVYIGKPNNIEKKLERLKKFYLYGLNQAGWNKYSYINVEFENQIICKKKSNKS